MSAEVRRRWSLVRVVIWVAQFPIAAVLYFTVPPKVFVAYLVLISVQTGVESAFAAYASDSE